MSLQFTPDGRITTLLSDYIKLNIDSVPLDRHPINTYDNFDSQYLPNINVDKGPFSSADDFMQMSHYQNSYSLIEKCNTLLGSTENTNCLVYYPNSFMRWHTNSDNPGIRIYYTYSLGHSIFRYLRDGKIVDDIDSRGWTARQFQIDPIKPLWHTVWSSGFRFSFGFNLTNA